MFYLRKVDKYNKRESNISLGKSYVYETKDTCKDWDKVLSKVLDWMNDEAKKNCLGVVYNSNGQPIPLFASSDNYIVTENGKTYSKLI